MVRRAFEQILQLESAVDRDLIKALAKPLTDVLENSEKGFVTGVKIRASKVIIGLRAADYRACQKV